MTTLTSDTVTVTIQGITEQFEAKIDTGAEQTSLHADAIQVTSDTVIFKINDRVYRADLEAEQAISSADGGEKSRPVIRAMIEVEGETVDTLINLNDRSGMPQPMLIGQDVIRSAGFTLQFTNEGGGTVSRPEEEELLDLEPSSSEETDLGETGSVIDQLCAALEDQVALSAKIEGLLSQLKQQEKPEETSDEQQ